MATEHEQGEAASMKSPFPTEAELLAAGYVSINFSNMPDVSTLRTNAGHPFPTHDEIVKAGYLPSSRRERRIQSRPRVGQMYWVDFPHDAYAPEFVNEHPGIVIRAANSLHDTCIVLPVTSAEQTAGTHFHQLSSNPNPKGKAQGITAFVVCDHIYTVNINRLRPVLSLKGQPVFPKVEQKDMEAIFTILKSVLSAAFSTSSVPTAPPDLASTAKPLGPNTLTLRPKGS